MTETDLDTQLAAPIAETEANGKTPWESMDPDEPAQVVPTARPVVRRALGKRTRKAAKAAKQAIASAATATAGEKMAGVASELQSLLSKEQVDPLEAITVTPLESSEDHLSAKAFLADAPSPLYSGERASVRGRASTAEDAQTSEVELAGVAQDKVLDAPPLTPTLSPEYRGEGAGHSSAQVTATSPEAEPTALDHTPWATIHETVAEPIAVAPVIAEIESAMPVQAETQEIKEPASTAGDETIGLTTNDGLVETTREEADEPVVETRDDPPFQATDGAIDERVVESDPEPPLQDTVDPDSSQPAITQPLAADAPETTFGPAGETVEIAMTAPIAVDDSGATSFVASIDQDESENLADEPVLVLDDAPAEVVATAQEMMAQPQAAVEPQLQTATASAPPRVATGGGWTIPIMCLGIGLIACCLTLPEMDFNRRLRYEQQNLQANLQSVEKQVAVNDEFLKKVMDDPTLAERLAGRQLKTMRKGQKVVEIKDISDDGDMSPFALVAVAPPVAPPPYSPIKGTLANICNSAQSRLYLLGAAMTMVAVGLVMGSSAKT